MLPRDEDTNEQCIPQSSNVVLIRKLEMLYVPLDFANHLAVDEIDDYSADSSANLETEMD